MLMTAAAIAASAAAIAGQTAEAHVGRILMKLGLRDRAPAVVFAYEPGLAEPRST